MTLRPQTLRFPSSVGSLLSGSRSISVSAGLRRDVMSKYRARPLPSIPSPAQSGGTGEFETSSTSPAGGSASIQDIPPPGRSSTGMRKAVPLPAMEPLSVAPSPTPAVAKKQVEEKDKEMIVQGMVIPAKPRPPTEEECCMSGCVHCVYNIYAEELEEYTEAIASAHRALIAAGTPKTDWPAPVRQLDSKSAGDTGNRGREQSGKEAMQDEAKEQVTQGMDPVLSAFLAMEGKLKKKQLASKGSTAPP